MSIASIISGFHTFCDPAILRNSFVLRIEERVWKDAFCKHLFNACYMPKPWGTKMKKHLPTMRVIDSWTGLYIWDGESIKMTCRRLKLFAVKVFKLVYSWLNCPHTHHLDLIVINICLFLLLFHLNYILRNLVLGGSRWPSG